MKPIIVFCGIVLMGGIVLGGVIIATPFLSGPQEDYDYLSLYARGYADYYGYLEFVNATGRTATNVTSMDWSTVPYFEEALQNITSVPDPFNNTESSVTIRINSTDSQFFREALYHYPADGWAVNGYIFYYQYLVQFRIQQDLG